MAFIIGVLLVALQGWNKTTRWLAEYHEKIKRQIKNKDTTLKIDIKEHGKGGKRKKYSITVTLEFARNIIKANAFDWEFARTIHKVMEKLITEIEHKFHVSEQR